MLAPALTRHLASGRRWAVLAVLCVSLLIVSLDNTILNIALPTLVRVLHATDSQLQWIVDIYACLFAGLLLVAGSIGDRIGRKKVLWASCRPTRAAWPGGSRSPVAGSTPRHIPDRVENSLWARDTASATSRCARSLRTSVRRARDRTFGPVLASCIAADSSGYGPRLKVAPVRVTKGDRGEGKPVREATKGPFMSAISRRRDGRAPSIGRRIAVGLHNFCDVTKDPCWVCVLRSVGGHPGVLRVGAGATRLGEPIRSNDRTVGDPRSSQRDLGA